MSILRIFSSGLESAATMNVWQSAVRFLTNTNCLNHDTSATLSTGFIKIFRIYKIKKNLGNLVKIPVQTILKNHTYSRNILSKKTLVFFIVLTASISTFGQNLFRYECSKNKYGYMNKKTGMIVVPCLYEDTYHYTSKGLIAVKLNNKWGAYDITGRLVVPIQYSSHEESISFSGDYYEEPEIPQNSENEKLARDIEIRKILERSAAYERELAREYEERKALAKADSINRPFLYFARDYVDKKISQWIQKGEFEPTIEFQKRVNETTRSGKEKEYNEEAKKEFIISQLKNKNHKIELGEYDADNAEFSIESNLFGNLYVPVPPNEARNFKENWSKLTKIPSYFIENDNLSLAEIIFRTEKGKIYKFSNKASPNQPIVQIAYSFESVEINSNTTTSHTLSGNQNISNINRNFRKSDVSENIPITKITNNKTFAVIIANENYQSEANVEFANNDGEIFKKYCIQTLGLPEKNVQLVIDATLNNIRREINWLSQVAKAFNGEASIIFYYAGHGIPDESSTTACLLPVDGYGSDVQSAYRLDDLYKTLGQMPAKSIIVFMDACFSGAQRSGDMMASARGVAIKTKPGAPAGNMVVFSAAQGDETAYPYKEKGHGMFTYFLLKKLQETKGDVTLGELGTYITNEVRQQSIVVNRKSQTPVVTPAAEIGEKWKGMRLR